MSQSIHPMHARLWEEVAPSWVPNEAFGHGQDHALRAYALARRICAGDRVDFGPVGAAVLIMDAGLTLAQGRSDHIRRGLELADVILPKFPELEGQKELIRAGIEHHEADNDIPVGLPAEVLAVRDADTLDRLGYSGFRTTIRYGIWTHRALYDLHDPGCQHRTPELDNYTFDYVRHLYSLVPRLSLPTSVAIGCEKARELDRFFSRALEALADGAALSTEGAMALATNA